MISLGAKLNIVFGYRSFDNIFYDELLKKHEYTRSNEHVIVRQIYSIQTQRHS